MRRQKGFGSDGSSASILATCYVVVIGALLCLFIVIAFRGDDAYLFYIVGAALLLLVFSLWLNRSKDNNPSSNAWVFWKSQKPAEDPLAEYACDKRRKAEKGELGTREPPSVLVSTEEREHRNWIPRETPPQENSDVTE